MKLENIIGWLIIFMLFAATFILIGLSCGLKVAVISFFIWASILAITRFAVHLIMK
jgi:hypothetical protein